MNPENNHLVDVVAHFGGDFSAAAKAGYVAVPDHLSKRAEKLLHGRSEVRVPRSGNDPLTKWAAEKRRNRRKMARESRRANRA